MQMQMMQTMQMHTSAMNRATVRGVQGTTRVFEKLDESYQAITQANLEL